MTTLAANRSNVPDTLRVELMRTGPTWLVIVIPVQKAALHAATMKPVEDNYELIHTYIIIVFELGSQLQLCW